MKNLLIVLVLIISCISCTSPVDITEDDNHGIVVGDDSYTKWDHANFYPQYVVSMEQSTTNTGNKVYYIIYDDPDAEFFNAIVRMDETTYLALEEYINKLEETGTVEKHAFVIAYKGNANVLLMEE